MQTALTEFFRDDEEAELLSKSGELSLHDYWLLTGNYKIVK